MLLKIHKDRVVAWLFFTIKEWIGKMMEGENFVSRVLRSKRCVKLGLWKGVKKVAGKINGEPQYIVYILEKK